MAIRTSETILVNNSEHLLMRRMRTFNIGKATNLPLSVSYTITKVAITHIKPGMICVRSGSTRTGLSKRQMTKATRAFGIENDRIRLYSIDGRCVQLPNETLPYSGTEWRLGNPNDRYILYYAPTPPHTLSVGTPEEISYRAPGVKSFFNEAVAAITMKAGSSAGQAPQSSLLPAVPQTVQRSSSQGGEPGQSGFLRTPPTGPRALLQGRPAQGPPSQGHVDRGGFQTPRN
ncbi:hypothetical protein F5Y13DRAFT_188950 [Hypoxylon sp. FL1857]|nr:hypothetical protein F5Y13DRAFT_188950 [Hypoxylon sp. FL1857]